MKTRIRELREDRDISQKTIAAYLCCDQSLYSKYELEKSEIPLYVIVRLAVYYNTSADFLLLLTDDPAPYARRLQRRGRGTVKDRPLRAKDKPARRVVAPYRITASL
jgi:transcriptional regulator with XRE-family HTH domain